MTAYKSEEVWKDLKYSNALISAHNPIEKEKMTWPGSHNIGNASIK